MKIYFGHSKQFDYLNELYYPIEKSAILGNETLLFPHKLSKENTNSRRFYGEIDLFIAEVTYPATGLGIELGWVFDEEIPVYCFHKKGTKPSSSILCVTNNIYEYTSTRDMITKIEAIVNNINKK